MHGTEKNISLTEVNQIVWNTKIVWGHTNCMTFNTNVWDQKKVCGYNAMQKKKENGQEKMVWKSVLHNYSQNSTSKSN